jgi:hypothetical protein
VLAAPTIGRWGVVAVWAILPLTAGPAFESALGDRDATFATSASIGLWLLWVLTLVATLVPRTVTLTLVRLVVPSALAAAAWAAAVTAEPSWRDALAVATTALAAVLAWAAPTADEFVNGSSYGPERRFSLRVPGPLLLGPLPFVWAATVAAAVTGPVLLAAEVVVAGILAALVGWPLAWLGARIVHRLSRRWIVFVPAGVVLVDEATLGDALLMQRAHIDRIGLASEGTDAEDLTAGALGIAVEVRFDDPQKLPTGAEARAVIFSPARPGAALAEAARRRFALG